MINKQHKNATLLISLFFLFSCWFIIININRSWAGIRVDFPSFYYAANLAFSGLSPYNKDIWEAVNLMHLPKLEQNIVIIFFLKALDFFEINKL